MSGEAKPAEAYVPAPVKCLLVDDLPENLLALEALLRQEGLEILQARSGAEALELLLVHDVALALLDVQMPEMDGFELAELMRGTERTRRVPIIFVTAGAHDQHRVFRGYDSGAVDFLHKPVEPRVLKNKAAVFFELYRQRQQVAHELRLKTEALRLSEMLMAVLGHDLRGPLSAMLMSAMVLQKRAENEPAKAAAARIIGSGKRMGRMIEDLLDLARTRVGGGIGIMPAELDLAEPVRRIVEEQRAAQPGRQIDWQHEGDCRGEWDADRIAQVVSNLIGNALRHGRADEPVTVRLDGSHADHVELCIGNAGGIPADLLPHIFDPFRSGRPRGSSDDGLGIGLYIVSEIARAHGGAVTVESSDDGPTTFRVRLPRRPPA